MAPVLVAPDTCNRVAAADGENPISVHEGFQSKFEPSPLLVFGFPRGGLFQGRKNRIPRILQGSPEWIFAQTCQNASPEITDSEVEFARSDEVAHNRSRHLAIGGCRVVRNILSDFSKRRAESKCKAGLESKGLCRADEALLKFAPRTHVKRLFLGTGSVVSWKL
jgi:hypothetical protein